MSIKNEHTKHEWFSSHAFYEEPAADLLLAIIRQAIEDSSIRIRDRTPLPKNAPRKPDNDGDLAEWEIQKKAHDRKVRNIQHRNNMRQELIRRRDSARFWLMDYDSNFPKIAGLLGIDVDNIRLGLRKRFIWANVWRDLP